MRCGFCGNEYRLAIIKLLDGKWIICESCLIGCGKDFAYMIQLHKGNITWRND